MAEAAIQPDATISTDAMVEHLRRARLWAWDVFDHRTSGVASELAWALIGLARDHDPDTYSPWLAARCLEQDRLKQAIELANGIARLIRKADALQPHLIRDRKAGE